MPNWWEQWIGTNPRVPGDDAHGDHDHDGYTNIEEYLHMMALPHWTDRPVIVGQFDLVELFRGMPAVSEFRCETESQEHIVFDVEGSTLTVQPKPNVPAILFLDIAAMRGGEELMRRRVWIRTR